MTETLTIDRRFCGPPTSGHGGYTGGLLAERLAAPAEVTLRRPPPLDTLLTLERDSDGSLSLLDGTARIAEARPATIDLEVPEPPTPDRAAAASQSSFAFTADNPFPTCFVCGPERPAGDGLRVFAGPLEGSGLMAAAWEVETRLADEDGRLADRFIWAALDCPGAYAVIPAAERTVVLGRMAARIDRSPTGGEHCVIVAWSLHRSGRKHEAGTALFDGRGQCCARARQTWIELRDDN